MTIIELKINSSLFEQQFGDFKDFVEEQSDVPFESFVSHP